MFGVDIDRFALESFDDFDKEEASRSLLDGDGPWPCKGEWDRSDSV